MGKEVRMEKKYLAYYFAMKSTSNKQVVFHCQSTDLSMIKSLREISMVLLKSKHKDKVGITIHQIDKALK
jgi:hypothetical protein